MQYPISQLFTAPQGEGFYVGTLMRFIRLAGCNVGKYEDPKENDVSALRVLHPDYSVCTSILGDRFLCDTNYKGIGKYTTEEALGFDKVGHVCITGGEPFMHNLGAMIEACKARGLQVHIETSGTKPIPENIAQDEDVWITCAPKEGFLPENRGKVSEWKFLVNEASHPGETVAKIKSVVGDDGLGIVYICSINSIENVNHEAVKRALEVQRLEPSFIIGVQLHKFLGTD